MTAIDITFFRKQIAHRHAQLCLEKISILHKGAYKFSNHLGPDMRIRIGYVSSGKQIFCLYIDFVYIVTKKTVSTSLVKFKQFKKHRDRVYYRILTSSVSCVQSVKRMKLQECGESI